MLDTARVIEVFAPRPNGARARGAIGTGYLVADDLVLTAAHVLDDGGACDMRPLGEADWHQAHVVWRGESCDAALLEADQPAFATAPIRLGRFMAGTRAPCTGVGFPAAQKRPGKRRAARDTEQLDGRLRPHSGLKSGLLTIDVDGSVPNEDDSGTSPWAGMSGAALFSGPLLIGVVVVDPAHYGADRLEAVPISAIAAEPAFRVALEARTGGEMVLEAVEEALTDALRPRLQTVLDGHPVFGGREAELDALDLFLSERAAGYMFVFATSGLGKTALLVHWLSSLLHRDDGPSVAYTFINSGRDGLGEEDFTLRNLCQQLGWLRGDFGALPASTAEVRARYAKLLVERPYGQDVVVILDGLDEATGWTPAPDLFPPDLPKGTRVVFSARDYADRGPDDWLRKLGLGDAGTERLPLATLGRSEVERLLARAEGAPDWTRAPEAPEAMLEVSAGDPFYLRFLIEDVQTGDIASVKDLRKRPKGLDGFLSEWWQQVSKSALAKPVRDLLGYLLVALGPLRAAELAQIRGDDELDGFTLEQALNDVRRFVVGDADHEGYTLSHPRFQAYLASTDGPLHGAASTYRAVVLQWASKWEQHRSRYAVWHLIGHLAEATRDRGGAARERAVEQLAALVRDAEFHRAHVDAVEDLPRLHRDLEVALDEVARADVDALTPVLTAAVGLEEFRSDWLRSESVFDLAMSGRLLDAERRLALFAAEDRWQQVARLVILWIGAELLSAGQPAPELPELKSRVAAEMGEWEPLPMMLERVRWQLGDRPGEPELRLPYGASALPAAPPQPIAEQIVARMGGASDPRERTTGLAGHEAMHGRPDAIEPGSDAAPIYLAESDGPTLVAFAAQNPWLGNDLLERYIRIHAANPYAEYRNRSLWGILGAVACHPDASQARNLITTLAEAALEPPPVAFRGGLRVTLGALRARGGDPKALDRFHELETQATGAAASLSPMRYQADAWGHHARRLAVLAEAKTLCLGRQSEALALLERARDLPFGFAGYRSSACLTLAEAMLACNSGDVSAGVPTVHDARRAAHNIQEPAFCALRTARVNAMLERWWLGPIDDLAAVIARFVADPLAAEFAPVHVVGEPYEERDPGPHMLEISSAMRNATSLREVANQVYEVPLTAMRQLQPDVDPDEPLALNTSVAVPERAFAPILAARLSAEALVSPAIAAHERSRSIRRLVPIAADNPTAMHTVLSRLLLAELPADPPVLDAIDALAPREWMQEPAAQGANEFGPY